MRINKYIANNIGISRRSVDEIIKKKHVKIDDRIATLGDQVENSNLIKVFIDNKWTTVSSNSENQVVLFYKPIFSLVSKKPEKNKKTIYDILPYKFNKLKPAGRLDYMSEGLLVLSSDGDLINKLTHPKNNTSKVYIVGLKNKLSREQISKSEQGIEIDNYKLNLVKISKLSSIKEYQYLGLDKKIFWYKFILTEGRNNQIRKMCSTFGQSVVRLIRVEQGEYKLTPAIKKNKFLEIS